ncbi:MAG: Mrp/NBP35 family ATP-binding protein [Bacteroidota bacterium]
MSLSVDNVLVALSKVIDPDLKKDLVTLGMIQDLSIEQGKISFTIVITTPACPFKESLKKACIKAIRDHVDQHAPIEIGFESRTLGKKKDEESLLPGVKNIIAVASGKGGVGKSTVSANLALSLAAAGAKVGLLDADVYGPSVPIMFGAVDNQLTSVEENEKVKVLPMQKYGISIMSIGFFVDASKALIWRGPMASSALKQLFTDVKWGDLDYLIVDLPPGTGDIHLSLMQTLQLTGVVVVSTPQDVALADARKAVSMFENPKLNVKVLGMIENMAWFTPAELPENRYYIFGKGGCRKLAEETGVPFLGEIPLVQSVCEAGDKGKPVFLTDDPIVKPCLEAITGRLAQEVSMLNATAGEINTVVG